MSGKCGALILCSGQSARFGSDKLRLPLLGKPVWKWSADAFCDHPLIDEVVIVAHEGLIDEIGIAEYRVVLGGSTRQESALKGLRALDTEYVLIHDGARPAVKPDLIARIVDATKTYGAAVPVLPLTDTVKQFEGERLTTLDRSKLVRVQTPQGGRREEFLRAHAELLGAVTDDASLLEKIGINVSQIPGDHDNMKLTTEDDGERIQRTLGFPETRTGLGYDVHAFASDPSRPLWLGGVQFEGETGLAGHSDADALLHAITDAILGAMGGGDIGQLFQNTDPRWKDMRSRKFVEAAVALASEQGWQLVHLDATVLAEAPKVMPRSHEIRSVIAEMTGLRTEDVSIKATTHEKLGAIGRGEGISAMAVATLRRWTPWR